MQALRSKWLNRIFCNRPRCHARSSSGSTSSHKVNAREKVQQVSPSQTSFHWDTPCATNSQLETARKFFSKTHASKLFTAGELYQVPYTSVPEVAFFGRSNVGKSSLLNAIMGANLCFTSSKPGRTRTMNGFAIGGPDGAGHKGRITILDMPGFGKGSREEWGSLIEKYLTKRQELKRVFLLVDAHHGLKSSDEVFLQTLRHSAIPHQIILSKVDRLLLSHKKNERLASGKLYSNLSVLQKLVESLKPTIQPKDDGPPALGEILACSTDMGKWKHLSTEHPGQLGINAIRWSIMVATGVAKSATEDSLKIIPNQRRTEDKVEA